MPPWNAHLKQPKGKWAKHQTTLKLPSNMLPLTNMLGLHYPSTRFERLFFCHDARIGGGAEPKGPVGGGAEVCHWADNSAPEVLTENFAASVASQLVKANRAVHQHLSCLCTTILWVKGRRKDAAVQWGFQVSQGSNGLGQLRIV